MKPHVQLTWHAVFQFSIFYFSSTFKLKHFIDFKVYLLH